MNQTMNQISNSESLSFQEVGPDGNPIQARAPAPAASTPSGPRMAEQSQSAQPPTSSNQNGVGESTGKSLSPSSPPPEADFWTAATPTSERERRVFALQRRARAIDKQCEGLKETEDSLRSQHDKLLVAREGVRNEEINRLSRNINVLRGERLGLAKRAERYRERAAEIEVDLIQNPPRNPTGRKGEKAKGRGRIGRVEEPGVSQEMEENEEREEIIWDQPN